ncbi:hypothetical protein VTH06DRAFT_790 [Thermothelomyces fergusii]
MQIALSHPAISFVCSPSSKESSQTEQGRRRSSTVLRALPAAGMAEQAGEVGRLTPKAPARAREESRWLPLLIKYTGPTPTDAALRVPKR